MLPPLNLSATPQITGRRFNPFSENGFAVEFRRRNVNYRFCSRNDMDVLITSGSYE